MNLIHNPIFLTKGLLSTTLTVARVDCAPVQYLASEIIGSYVSCIHVCGKGHATRSAAFRLVA